MVQSMHRKIEYPYDLIASYTQHFQHDNFSVESKRNTKFVLANNLEKPQIKKTKRH